MLSKPLLIATIAAGLSVATFSPQASADPVGGAIVGSVIGAAVGGPPGAAIGAVLGTAIGTDAYYYPPAYAYDPAPYRRERYYDYAPAPVYFAPPPVAYYAPAPVYYVPQGIYARPAHIYGPRRSSYRDGSRHYAQRYGRGSDRQYR